jgi:hypothetical protein
MTQAQTMQLDSISGVVCALVELLRASYTKELVCIEVDLGFARDDYPTIQE